MTTAYQFVFDRAANISLDCRRVIGTTVTRNNTVRTVSRGGQVWTLTVTMPSGLPWSTVRGNIAAYEALDRVTVATVGINDSGYNSWLTVYQGTAANPAAITASWTQGANSITLTGGQAGSGFNFRAGDLLQLGSGRVYQVTADVASGTNTVPVNRPVIDSTGSGTLKVGPAVTWSVICTEMPQWTISDRNVVSWSGPFVFFENMV